MRHIIKFESFINESRSRYDGISSKLTKRVFKTWILDWKAGKKLSKYSESIELNGLEFDLDATLYFDKVNGTAIKNFQILGSTGANSDSEDEEGDYQTSYIIIDFAINSEWVPGYWQDIYMYLADAMRHEIEHITQGGENYRPGKPNDDDSVMRKLIQQGFLPEYQYLLLPKEVDANLQGLRFESKKRREPMIDAINRYLDIKSYSPKEREEILTAWRIRAKTIGGIPKF